MFCAFVDEARRKYSLPIMINWLNAACCGHTGLLRVEITNWHSITRNLNNFEKVASVVLFCCPSHVFICTIKRKMSKEAAFFLFFRLVVSLLPSQCQYKPLISPIMHHVSLISKTLSMDLPYKPSKLLSRPLYHPEFYHSHRSRRCRPFPGPLAILFFC